ncbi:signal peptidase II [Mycoplasma sp. Mirounga ES2805-ORL]|uniref:signal peptidase II n=1 Tax=Mycoplasma sp. Mirounga ES2805-ORL TaxID=754514 RepID=UPI00197C15A9|nr:signal peptidase II [Mycoplasma sp. Mirounga ES2805-ORL]QSF13935.1 signal peptidase II [Mycoplasma sp. Mirounga ES2805-ORL]
MSKEVDGYKKTFGEKLKESTDKFITFHKNLVKDYKQNTKKRLLGIGLFWLVFIVFLTIDQLTKGLLFDSNKLGQATHDFGLFGIRPYYHDGVTIIPSKTIGVAIFVQIVSVILCLLIVYFSFIFKDKYLLTILALILSGVFGNMFDRFYCEKTIEGVPQVRDIIFLPWIDKGTFNFADTSIFIALALSIIMGIIYLFKDDKDEESKINEDSYNIFFIPSDVKDFKEEKNNK